MVLEEVPGRRRWDLKLKRHKSGRFNSQPKMTGQNNLVSSVCSARREKVLCGTKNSTENFWRHPRQPGRLSEEQPLPRNQFSALYKINGT